MTIFHIQTKYLTKANIQTKYLAKANMILAPRVKLDFQPISVFQFMKQQSSRTQSIDFKGDLTSLPHVNCSTPMCIY